MQSHDTIGLTELEWKKTEEGYEVRGMVPIGASASLETGGENIPLTSGEFIYHI